MSRLGTVILHVTLLPALASLPAVSAVAATGTATPNPRAVPGLTTIDTHPLACVDCHIAYPDRGLDARLGQLLEKWTAGDVEPALLELARASAPDGAEITGRHPESTDSLRDVPDACLDCHDDDSTEAPRFSRLIHLVHLSGGSSNHFMTSFQGECTLCHKLDERSGQWSVPSGPAQ